MEHVKPLLESAMPFWERHIRILLPEQCWHQIVAMTFSGVCLSMLFNLFLNTGVMVASAFVKLPQILKIFLARSVTGIAEPTYYLEVAYTFIYVGYNVSRGNAFGVWGESAFVAVQNVTLLMLFWSFSKPDQSKIPYSRRVSFVSALIVFCYIVKRQLVPPIIIPLLGILPIPLSISSILPQIIKNFKQGHTGQISLVTITIQLMGNIVRIYTSKVQANDLLLMTYFCFGATLKGILFSQVCLYQKATAATLSTDSQRSVPAKEKRN
ncbi:PQ loop repeat-containing protein [Cardiosporidium cionae]|uniref:Mannose-P-dolichol utilization defect 1 protein homolog n=1 Tax=Cardiosporidium cionae TaxID=476202 RepID=A0ABQ7J8C9_9APIC|nr:PQ loop repeat-containing protein [Cardiosporidium cionae]|eukprot:KAF8820219.1 PQ loop repeat-containing protein [Cardiosporidium cionae]